MSTATMTALRTALESVAVPADAGPMAAYMRDRFPFLGVKTPARRKASRPTLHEFRTAEVGRVVALVDVCWNEPEREFQYVGSDLIVAESGRFGPDRLADLRRWIVTKSWWDTVDALASKGVGAVVRRHPHSAGEMDVWIADDDMWIRRSAILHQLTFKENTDEDRLFGYVLTTAGETEFFIRKASGWALREYAKTAPEAVRRFVAEHADALSGLTRREALEHL